MREYTFLMQVCRKNTTESIFGPQEFVTDTDDIYFAKHRFLQLVEEYAKYQPKFRNILEACDWYIDGVLLE